RIEHRFKSLAGHFEHQIKSNSDHFEHQFKALSEHFENEERLAVLTLFFKNNISDQAGLIKRMMMRPLTVYPMNTKCFAFFAKIIRHAQIVLWAKEGSMLSAYNQISENAVTNGFAGMTADLIQRRGH